jgi:hypothetical protein
MRRTASRVLAGTITLVLATLFFGALGLASAEADDPLPLPIVPPGMTAPPELVPPSGGGPDAFPTELPGRTESLSPPSQQQIDDARDALNRLEQGSAATTSASPVVEVAGPQDPRSVSSRLRDANWWILGAGLLVLVVASEVTRIGVRRAKHRKEA